MKPSERQMRRHEEQCLFCERSLIKVGVPLYYCNHEKARPETKGLADEGICTEVDWNVCGYKE